jgi:hypothetical protein
VSGALDGLLAFVEQHYTEHPIPASHSGEPRRTEREGHARRNH